MRRRFLPAALLLPLAAVAALALPSVPAGAQSIEVRTTPVFPGLERQEISFRLDDGRTAVANVLSFSAADPALELRTVLAQDRVPGLESVPAMGRRVLARSGVAGINGGFWLRSPVGDPNGYLSLGRRLVSEAETQGAGPRGTLARLGDGALVMDRIATRVSLRVNGEPPSRMVTALNRFHRGTPPYPDDTTQPIYLYTPDFGDRVQVDAITVEEAPLPLRVMVVDGLVPSPSGRAEGIVDSVSILPGEFAIPSSGTVVVAHGEAATAMATVVPGDQLSVNVEVEPLDSQAGDWEDVVDALAAGPLLVRDGERVDPASWENEGFAPNTHSNVRHPRSAVGVTGDGRVLLVTVDGRQPGYSAGMTMHELAHFLRTLGVRDGLSLDGGGSSQLVIDGVLRNRPCCDQSVRPVATGLFVFYDYVFTAAERIAGSGREATAAAVALAGYPAGADEVVIAAAVNFPDALAGGPLARQLEAPLLLTGHEQLPAATLEALEALDPERVTILGGSAAVSDEVEATLRADYEVRRLSGDGRAKTAVAIAEAMGEEHPRVFLARADQFPDALSAAGPGGMLGMPILLTGRDQLPADTSRFLERADVEEVVVLGGGSAVSDDVTDELRSREVAVTRLAGTSRFGTAAAVNRWTIDQVPNLNDEAIVVAAGGTFPDALAGGPLAALRRQLLMIAPSEDITADAEAAAFFAELDDSDLERVTLIGGHAVLSTYAQWQLDRLAVE